MNTGSGRRPPRARTRHRTVEAILVRRSLRKVLVGVTGTWVRYRSVLLGGPGSTICTRSEQRAREENDGACISGN